jgi:hypothetical protein
MANEAETCSLYICNKENKGEQQPKLHIERKCILKTQTYTVQQNVAIQYFKHEGVWQFSFTPAAP